MAYGRSSRYTCVSLYRLVAMVWIFIFVFNWSVGRNKILKGIIYAGFVMIFAGLLLTTFVAWHNQSQRKADFERLYNTAIQVDTAAHDELLNFDVPPEKVRNSCVCCGRIN